MWAYRTVVYTLRSSLIAVFSIYTSMHYINGWCRIVVAVKSPMRFDARSCAQTFSEQVIALYTIVVVGWVTSRFALPHQLVGLLVLGGVGRTTPHFFSWARFELLDLCALYKLSYYYYRAQLRVDRYWEDVGGLSVCANLNPLTLS